MDGSTGFTCVTCRVVFETADLQRDHYKTEWHRYNLKRQAAELPAIGFELFNEKSASFNPSKSAAPVEVEPLYCKACHKAIKSENAMTDHLASKKHKENEKKDQDAEKKGPKQPRKKAENLPKKPESVEEEEDDDDSSEGWETDDEEGIEGLNDDEALPATSCLFCPQTKPSLEEMREHMNFHHGFQLPDRKYLVDELGCLSYLGLKVGAGRCCIYCPDVKARYATVEGCQQHMRDKQHCKLRRDPESMIELDDFYDYSSMYEDDDNKSELFDDGWSLTLPSGEFLIEVVELLTHFSRSSNRSPQPVPLLQTVPPTSRWYPETLIQSSNREGQRILPGTRMDWHYNQGRSEKGR